MMLKIKTIAFSLLLAGAAVQASAAEPPAKLPAPVIAVVDVQRIMQESAASQSAQKQLDAQRLKFQNESEREENGLRAAEKELVNKRGELSPQAYAEREQQLRQRFAVVENHVQSRRKTLDRSFTAAMNTVRGSLLDVVDQTAHEHGANIVINKQQALWSEPSLDLTDEVLKRFDAKMPKIDIPSSETP